MLQGCNFVVTQIRELGFNIQHSNSNTAHHLFSLHHHFLALPATSCAIAYMGQAWARTISTCHCMPCHIITLHQSALSNASMPNPLVEPRCIVLNFAIVSSVSSLCHWPLLNAWHHLLILLTMSPSPHGCLIGDQRQAHCMSSNPAPLLSLVSLRDVLWEACQPILCVVQIHWSSNAAPSHTPQWVCWACHAVDPPSTHTNPLPCRR